MFGRPRRVSAATRSIMGYEVEDTAALVLEHVSGVIGTFVTVFGGVVGREESRMEVFFRDGIVEITWGVLVDTPENTEPGAEDQGSRSVVARIDVQSVAVDPAGRIRSQKQGRPHQGILGQDLPQLLLPGLRQPTGCRGRAPGLSFHL